jgi:NitT/TauT family transport system substrate-binding protein
MSTRFGQLLVILFLWVSACAPSDTSYVLTPVVIQLAGTHHATSAGFYAADLNGDYAREGLAVSFLEGTADLDLGASLVDGKAQFGVMGASALISARAAGQPLRALATILRYDPSVFVSLADSGIARLEDFAGKKVLVSPRGRPRLYSMLARVGMTPEDIVEVNSGNFTDLYTGDIDVANTNIAGDVLSAKQAGYKVNLIYPDDYGVHFYGTSIFTTDDYIAADPDLVTRFLRATLQGWTYAVENPQEIGDMVLRYNPNVDNAFETASMVASLPYINTGEDHIGWMKPEIWEGMAQTMRNQGVLTTPLNITEAYTLYFIQKIYGETNP